jgi:hypothetical protein
MKTRTHDGMERGVSAVACGIGTRCQPKPPVPNPAASPAAVLATSQALDPLPQSPINVLLAASISAPLSASDW